MIKAIATYNKQSAHINVFKLVGLLLLFVFMCRTLVYASSQKMAAGVSLEIQDQTDADDSQADCATDQPDFVTIPNNLQLSPVFTKLANTCFLGERCCFDTQHCLAVLTPPPNC